MAASSPGCALPTLADAILDRVVHSSNKMELKVTRSMRDDGSADLP